MSQKDKCETRLVTACGETELQTAEVQGGCPTWTFCLPFGGQLSSEGGCVNYTPPGNPPTDGVYGKIVVVDGCITSVEPSDIPLYTSGPCAPVPSPCDCDGGSGLPDPSTATGNLFGYDASGRPLVKVYMEGGDGIAIDGNGTSSDPFIVEADIDIPDTQYFRSGNAAITLSGTGTASDPYTYTHMAGLTGKQGLYTFEYGHAVAYEPASTVGTINGILEGDGIKVSVETSTGIATISLADPTNLVTGTFSFGGYDVEFYRNRLVRVERVITNVAGDYVLQADDGGTYTLSYDDYGSLKDVVYTAAPVPDSSITYTNATKRFTVTGNSERELTFTTDRDSGFRISYKENNMPTDVLMFINGSAVDGYKFPTANPYMFEAVPLAMYRAGTHTVLLQSEIGFSSVGIMDVVLTTVQ